MINETVVDLSRLQFGLTAMYHFIFVPLTLGLSFIMAIMESVYVMTNKPIYKEMTRFWGKLFGINFAMGVATGITLEFQFGTNWAYYAHYVGDIFGVPLAIEGLMAFFLESTFVGLFFFGWDRLSKVQHCVVTWLVAIGANLSALWILIANAWMQYPVGAEFNYDTMRMELLSLREVFFNPVAQVKFVHTVASGYVTGAMFVLGISAYYLLQKRHLPFARRSFAVAAGFGLASILSVIVLGDESGYGVGEVQQTKLAVIEAEWETHPPPAPFTLFGLPNQETQQTDYAVKIPYALGLIATRSTEQPVIGIKDLVERHEDYIRYGMQAYEHLQTIQAEGMVSPTLKQKFEEVKPFLGYGLLLKRYTDNVVDATPEQVKQAALDTIPQVAPLFWTFRIMVFSGFAMLFIFIMAFYLNIKGTFEDKPWILKMALWGIPLPWIAIFSGWFVAEYGRQPWAIAEVLPTRLGASSLTTGQVMTSMTALVVLYTILLIVELKLMFSIARRGPAPKTA